MAFSFEELREEDEQTETDGKDAMEKAFLFLEMALVNYQQTLQQIEAEQEEEDRGAIFNGFQNLIKEEGRKKARKMKDLRFKKIFKKKKNKMQNKYNDSEQKKKEIQKRRDASKAEARRRGGRKIWWGKKERGKAEKSHKVLKLDGKKRIFFRDNG